MAGSQEQSGGQVQACGDGTIDQQADRDRQSAQRAQEPDRGRLGEEEYEQIAVGGPDRLAQPDFLVALQHSHQQRVGDSQGGDAKRRQTLNRLALISDFAGGRGQAVLEGADVVLVHLVRLEVAALAVGELCLETPALLVRVVELGERVRDLDPIRWRQLDHNPIALLSEFTPERLEMRHRLRRNPLDDSGSSTRVERALRELFGA